jgi:hypothetical protein
MPWMTGGAGEAGRLQDWAEETHRVAVEAVYLFPSSREIDERYMEKAPRSTNCPS